LLNTPGPKEKLFVAGFEVIGSTPEEFAAWMKAEMVRWGKVIRDAGIRSQ
jgi:tripartite-type tricarboxylate transporter receptor subunit TctC